MDKPETLAELKPQEKNPNLHTERGLDMLEKSIQGDGWIGAMTVAADGEAFDGSARLEKAVEVFGADAEPIVVESDGTRPIVVKRTDIPGAEDPRFNRLSVAANRIAEVDLQFDPAVLAELAAFDAESEDKVLPGLFTQDELVAVLIDIGEAGNGQSRIRTLKLVTCPDCGTEFPLEKQ